MRRISFYAGTGTAFVLLAALAWGADPTDWSRQKEAGRKAFEQGHYVEAEAFEREALGMLQHADAADSHDLAGCLNDLGLTYSALGKFSEAEGLYRQALQIWQTSPGYEVVEARILSNLSNLMVSEARFSEAEELALRSIEIHERLLGPGHIETAPALTNLGQVYGAEGQF